jgi:hypothetical protein
MKKKAFSPAGCFFKIAAGTVFVGTTAWLITSDFVTSRVPQSWQGPGVASIVVVAVLIIGVELATVILSPGSSTPFGILGRKGKDCTIEAVRAKGELEQRTFHARRVFEVAERGDEGLHYFVELVDDSTLYLTGQYLYDFVPISDDPELEQPRLFPCTEFVISRDKKNEDFIQLDCKGPAIEPECITPPFSSNDHKQGRVPDDGDVITDVSYDELKSQRLAA